MKFRAEFKKINNKIPMNDFLLLLNNDEKADIYAHIDKLLELKNANLNIPEKLSKYLRNGIFELRIRHKNRISRCLYFYEIDGFIIFILGFIKKTEKTPISFLNSAIKIKNSKN